MFAPYTLLKFNYGLIRVFSPVSLHVYMNLSTYFHYILSAPAAAMLADN